MPRIPKKGKRSSHVRREAMKKMVLASRARRTPALVTGKALGRAAMGATKGMRDAKFPNIVPKFSREETRIAKEVAGDVARKINRYSPGRVLGRAAAGAMHGAMKATHPLPHKRRRRRRK